ncbi:hypothetical protein GSI_06178 [Ganoderma sinense ZZ0214-1]|uniref:SnoaL-like domain-containing protein n=1 Tax=Ganoderma sinense ZZ0214-1 TaxID=1077348 RepID=A0A2G8SCH8_9APHY|nr:hypothetical protein GSI_06178 [Ganoderma sinense ZZ0214-1]
MPLSDPNAKNASGLTPNESKSLKERNVEPHEQLIIAGVRELYSCKPTNSTYEIYATDAVFHDPVGIAQGVDKIRHQFNGLAQLFPRADIPAFRVLENPSSVPTSTILIDQEVDYYRNPQGSPIKRINSLLTIETNEQHKVVRHTEEWDHRKETTREDGFWGMLNEYRKKITADVTSLLTSREPPTTRKEPTGKEPASTEAPK